MEYLKNLLQSIQQIINILSVIPTVLIKDAQVDHGGENSYFWKVSSLVEL